MKKLFLLAAFALLGFGLASAFHAKETKLIYHSTVEKNTAKKTVVVSGFISTKFKKKYNEPEPRTYTTSCGTWTVKGSFTNADQEQLWCNSACTNGWTWWKVENGVFSGGTGTPGGNGSQQTL